MKTFGEWIHGIRKELLYLAAAFIVLGLLLVLFPETTAQTVTRVAGAALCVWGALRLLTYFLSGERPPMSSFGLVQGVALLAFGLFFLLRPDAVVALVTSALAILVVVDGILKIQYGVEFERMQVKGWWVQLVVGGAMVVLGIIAFIDPFKAARTFMSFVGWILLVEGVWDFISVLVLNSETRRLARRAEQSARAARAVDVEYEER